MKALAAEMVRNFGARLEPLGVAVRELTGDMQLTKAEIQKTQVSQWMSVSGCSDTHSHVQIYVHMHTRVCVCVTNIWKNFYIVIVLGVAMTVGKDTLND